jgi:hypothetical protein
VYSVPVDPQYLISDSLCHFFLFVDMRIIKLERAYIL